MERAIGESTPDFRPRTVAVIDDQIIMRSLLRTVVEGAGHHVVEAKCLADGLEVIRKGVLHAIISDLDLGTKGHEALDGDDLAKAFAYRRREGLLLLQAARERGIDQRVLCSGTSHDAEGHPAIEGAMLLKKPFDIGPLQQWLAGLNSL